MRGHKFSDRGEVSGEDSFGERSDPVLERPYELKPEACNYRSQQKITFQSQEHIRNHVLLPQKTRRSESLPRKHRALSARHAIAVDRGTRTQPAKEKTS